MQKLITDKQLSIYLILFSLVVSAAMMHPGFTTLLIAVPVNAVVLFALRWVAHRESESV